MKTALVTGITGQDGSYLAELLLGNGYRVCGMVRRVASPNFDRIRDIKDRIEIRYADLLDLGSLIRLVEELEPDEIYNLAAQSFVPTSFEQPVLTSQTTGLGVTNVLEAIRVVNPHIRFYQASSSEMFGKVVETPQTESTPFHPRSPYGVAKAYGHWMTVNYREAYGIHASSGILFNHESPRRGPEFVTRKVSRAAARIKLGLQSDLGMGNLDAQRDWGFAGDYVRAMWMMLQQDRPGDYVVASGGCHSIRELLAVAFACVDLEWQRYVIQDSQYVRPAEVEMLCGDPTRARERLGWTPDVGFEELIRMMVESDLEIESRQGRVVVPAQRVPATLRSTPATAR